MKQIYERTPMASVISIKLQSMEKLHPWLFSCKFSAYFQNNFPKNTSGWLLWNMKFQVYLHI